MKICLTEQMVTVGLKALAQDALQNNGCLYLHLLHTPINEWRVLQLITSQYYNILKPDAAYIIPRIIIIYSVMMQY